MLVQVGFNGLDTQCVILSVTTPVLACVSTAAVRLKLIADRLYDRFAVAVSIRDHENAVFEAFGFQALFDYFQRRLFLANDKQTLLSTNCVCDHVDDGLAFPGTRRSFD